MKALDKEGKSDNRKRHIDHLLVEDPDHQHLLISKKRHSKTAVDELIELKKTNNKKNRSTGLLVSSVSLCLSLLFCILMFEWRIAEREASVDLNGNNQNFEDLVEIPQTQQIQRPPVQVQAPAIIEVDDEEIIEEIEINLDIEMTEDTRIEQVVYDQSDDNVLPEEDADEIFTIVEEQPAPVGGMRAFYEYVGRNLKYPAKAARMGVEGRVFVEFVVEKDGSLSDIKVAKGIGAGCNEEAVRVISQAPNWKPGKQRGNAVRVRMVMPIMFRLVAA